MSFEEVFFIRNFVVSFEKGLLCSVNMKIFKIKIVHFGKLHVWWTISNDFGKKLSF